VAAGIVILDLSTKSLVLHLSDNFTDNALIADKFFDIGVFWHSGLLADVGPTAALIIQCAANIVWVFLLVKSQNRASAVGAALLLGGGIGNLVTWLAFSRVLNIFRFDIGQSNPFGFNIGDVATLLGVIILLGSWSSSVLHRQ
jgi:lipoprotein signal peptidase